MLQKKTWPIVTIVRTSPKNLKALQRDLPDAASKSEDVDVRLTSSGRDAFGAAFGVLVGTARNTDRNRIPHDIARFVQASIGKGTFHLNVDTYVGAIR